MALLLPAFKVVSMIFAVSAVVTGLQAIATPTSFSKSFGIPIENVMSTRATPSRPENDPSKAYVGLMGVRQLATGLTLLTFAYQRKWAEMATILSILGFVVAGTDGIFLAQSGAARQAMFHAIPGALIALLAVSIAIAGS
jgi:hypothetical protein